MPAATTRLYLGFDLHPGQLEIRDSKARFRVLNCGRRWGKSVVCRAAILEAVGDGLRVAYMCPTNKMLMDMWRAIRNILAPITVEKNEQEHRIQTVNGAVVEFWSLDNPDGPRGREYHLVIIDEAAVIPSGDTWQEVIRPTLMSTHGRALFASTPKGYNWFWQLWMLGERKLDPEWESWKKPTVNNPFIDPREIESARRTTPINIFAQEYEAEFVADAGAVFRRIDEAAIAPLQEAPLPGHTYVLGADLAKTNDFSVYTVIDTTIMAVAFIDRANHVDYKLQRGRLEALARRFHVMAAVVEQNTNLAFMEDLMGTGLPIVPFTTGVNSKALIIEGLAGAFDNDRLRLLDKTIPVGAEALNELHAFQMERLPSGAFRYAGPRDTNDDMVMSLALAYHGATYGAPRWAPELIEIGRPAPGATEVSVPGVFLNQVQMPAPPPRDVAWPTAEYIYGQ